MALDYHNRFIKLLCFKNNMYFKVLLFTLKSLVFEDIPLKKQSMQLKTKLRMSLYPAPPRMICQSVQAPWLNQNRSNCICLLPLKLIHTLKSVEVVKWEMSRRSIVTVVACSCTVRNVRETMRLLAQLTAVAMAVQPDLGNIMNKHSVIVLSMKKNSIFINA